MSFASRMNKVATRLLTKFDERATPIKIIKLGVGTVFDEVLGEFVAVPDEEYAATGVVITISESMVNGTTIQAGDKMVTLSTNLGYRPTTADKVILDGEQWSIVDTPHVEYTGRDLPIVYKMQVRK
jgi:hypothetical protein